MKPKSSRVPHRRRQHIANDALHVTLKLIDGLPNLRKQPELERITHAIEAAQERFGCRIIAFSLMRNHMHLTIEAPNKEELARAMKGLKVRMVRALNRLWRRSGSIFLERYHAVALRGLQQAHRTMRYVLNNARRHGLQMLKDLPDPFSSGPWFANWKERFGAPFRSDRSPVAEPRSRILQLIWKLPIGINEVPGPWLLIG